MIVKGYLYNINEISECEIYIEAGKLHSITRYPLDSRPYSFRPYNKKEFRLEKIASKEIEVTPYNCNYEFTFPDINRNQTIVFLKLNWLKSVRIKMILRKYIIQSKQMQTNILKYIIGGIIGAVITVIVSKLS